MKKLSAAILASVILLAIAGCSSGPATYATPAQLRKAFIAAGGKCGNPSDVGEEYLGTGAHGVLCTPDINMLIVFDTEAEKNRYVAETVGNGGIQAVVGPRWIVATKNADKFAAGLGGKVEK